MKKESKKGKEEKEKKLKQKVNKNKINGNVLKISLYTLVILIISLIAFVGIYITDKNKMINILPAYLLGGDLNGYRNIAIKVDDSIITTNYDAEGKEIESSDTETQVASTSETPTNDSSVLTLDNYKKIKDIIIDRLKYMNTEYYEVKLNETDGSIYIIVPENDNTDYIAQYSVTKGDFKIIDKETEETLLDHNDLEKASIAYNTTESGTTVYLAIKFNKQGTEKLKNVSNTYISTKDADGNETKKEIKMLLDSSEIITTTFSEEIQNGEIQLSLGTSTVNSEIQTSIQQASNIAIFLNTETMPIVYEMEVNRFVYSDITNQKILILISIMASIYLIMLIYMIIKYKKQGFLGAISSIGFIAILLIVIRFSNVQITLPGLITIFIPAIIEYIFLMRIFKVHNMDMDKEIIRKQIKNIIWNECERVIPITIIAIVFALIKWEPIYSIGMILFWGVIILLIYNIITLKINLIKFSKKIKNNNKTKNGKE